MLGFLASVFGGPVGLTVAVVSTVATVAMASSSSSSGGSKSSNREEVESDYREDKKERIQADIDDYIKMQTQYIKQKYNVEIAIRNEFEAILFTIMGPIVKNQTSDDGSLIQIIKEDKTLENTIEKLKVDISDIETAIELLEGEKSEIISTAR